MDLKYVSCVAVRPSLVIGKRVCAPGERIEIEEGRARALAERGDVRFFVAPSQPREPVAVPVLDRGSSQARAALDPRAATASKR